MVEKSTKLNPEFLAECSPIDTLASLSSYMLPPQNQEKTAMIEFAIRFAAGICRGTQTADPDKIQSFVQEVGELYKRHPHKSASSLQTGFMNRALFVSLAEGNVAQTINSIWKRFQKHDQELEEKLGFNVANAIYFSSSIMSQITARMENTKGPKIEKLSKSEYYDFGFYVMPEKRIIDAWSNAIIFDPMKLSESFKPTVRERFAKYLDFASIDSAETPQVKDPLEVNWLFGTPIMKFNTKWIVPIPYYLLHGLSFSLHKELAEDPKYSGTYRAAKGPVLEEWAYETLRRAFPKGKVFKNVHYDSTKGNPDADIVVSCGDLLIFAECTTKWITPDSASGVQEAIDYTLDKSITKCYKQALRAKKAYLEGRLELELEIKPSRIVPMIITDSQYPNLLSEYALARRFGGSSYIDQLVKNADFPYVVSIFDLDAISVIVDQDVFIRFLIERLEMYKTPYFLAYDEFDYFVLFCKPEYEEIKRRTIEREVTMNYTAHVPFPVTVSQAFVFILETIGSDDFAVIKIGKKYDKNVAAAALGLAYDVYNSWDKAMNHLVFDLGGFNSKLMEYRNRGQKCRVIVWEGLNEHLKFNRDTKRPELNSETETRLNPNSIGKELSVLIVIPTDMYQQIKSKLKEKMPKRRFKEVFGTNLMHRLSKCLQYLGLSIRF